MIVIITITIPITVHQRDSSGETRVGSIIAALSAQREPDGLPPMMTLFIFIITTTAVIIYITIIIIFTRPLLWRAKPQARIQLKPVLLGVFSTSHFGLPALSSDWILLFKCEYEYKKVIICVTYLHSHSLALYRRAEPKPHVDGRAESEDKT